MRPCLHRLIALVLLLALHASASYAAEAPASAISDALKEWQVIDVKAARPISFDDWSALLADQDVIYLGEEHRNKWHIEGALRILQALVAQNRRPALAVEMFGWDGQAGLNQYLAEDQTSREQFLETARWEQNWGGPFEEYAPLIAFARDQRVPVLALNPPRPLVRRVASQGLARALADAEMSRWGMQRETFTDDPGYRDVIVRQLRLCHGGMSEDGYQRMYEASLFRDESMAKTIADYLARQRQGTERHTGPLISYTGGGHIQYDLPVPNRVRRKAGGVVKQVTVYMTSLASDSKEEKEEIEHLVQEAIADYVWLTPVSAHGPSKRCR